MSVLNKTQEEFIKELKKTFIVKDFFLTGGTALSEFYLKHRLSEDLDFFTTKENVQLDIVNAEIVKIAGLMNLKTKNKLTFSSIVQYEFFDGSTLLKIDFVKDIPIHFGVLKTIDSLQIDSLENLAVGKLLACFGRNDPKDFVDLFFLFEIEKLISFEEVFEMAKKKDVGLNEFYLANAFLQAKKISLLPKMLKPLNKTKMEVYFENLAKVLYKKIKPKE